MNPSTQNMPLAEIVAEAQRGNPTAVEQIVLRTRAMATHYAFAILGDRAMAEDAAQEALADAVSSPCRLEGSFGACWCDQPRRSCAGAVDMTPPRDVLLVPSAARPPEEQLRLTRERLGNWRVGVSLR